VSNFLAIATVTAAVRQVLFDAVSKDVPGAMVEVSHTRPGGDSPATPDTGVNVYLYGVSPNAALRNDDLPTRSQSGRLAQRPRAALDLHYLLTFYGDDTALETQRLLGSVARTLHAAPTLPRAKLTEVIGANAFLKGSDMADAVEAVRFTPLSLSLDDLSKLWSVLFQTPYALSAVYQASVVLIESTQTPEPGLPVRTRTVTAVPFTPARIDAVDTLVGPREPITATSTLVLRGTGLRGDRTRVRIRDELLTPTALLDDQVTVPLSLLSATGLRAGVHGVQVVHERLLGDPPTFHAGEESNVAPFVLRPTISVKGAGPDHDITYTAAVPGPPAKPATLAIRLTPDVGGRQRAVLLLTGLGASAPAGFRFEAPQRGADGPTVTFEVPGVPAGSYLVRVQIDGAESVLTTDGGGAYSRPRVVIP